MFYIQFELVHLEQCWLTVLPATLYEWTSIFCLQWPVKSFGSPLDMWRLHRCIQASARELEKVTFGAHSLFNNINRGSVTLIFCTALIVSRGSKFIWTPLIRALWREYRWGCTSWHQMLLEDRFNPPRFGIGHSDSQLCWSSPVASLGRVHYESS